MAGRGVFPMGFEVPASDAEFIRERKIDGFDAEEIAHLLRTDEGSSLTADTVKEYLEREDVQKKIELEKRIMEKRQDVSREDLIRDLRDIKDTLQDRAEVLRDKELDEISNDTVKNVLRSVEMLADMLGELKSTEGAGSANTVNINELNQEFDLTSTVQFLPPEDKRSVVEQLEDDPEVEDFMILRQDEVEMVERKGEEVKKVSAEE